MLHRRPMLVNLIFYVLPFLRLVSALFNVTTALFSDGHIITGLWSEAMDCGYYTSTLNSSVSLTFKGVSIHVLGDLSLYGGIAHITLDDHPAQMIDLYGAASCGQVLFSRTGLANGEHSLKLALTGESPNMTSTDGPDRLLVLTNFIWSSLAPTLLSPSAELPLPAPFSQPLMPRSPLPAPPSDQPLPPPSTQPPPPPPSSDQPLPPPSTQPPPPPPSSDQPLPPPSTQPPSPSSTPEPPIPSPSSQPLSPSLSPSIQSSSLLPPSSSPPVSPSSPSSPSSASSSLRSSSSALSSSLLFSPSSSLTSRSPTQLSSVPTQLSPVPTQLSSVPTQLSTKSPSSFTTSSKYVIPPTSTLPPESVPTVTAVAAGPAPDLSPVLQLWTCKPYGPNDCAFIPQAAAGLNDFSLIVGTPASNCGGGTANLIAVVGGQLSITDTWSQDLSAGLSLGNAAGDLILNISGTQTWQNSQIRRSIEVVNMTIPPERQGALVAQVTYSTTNGMLQIGDQSPFSVLANQPQNGIQYQANIIPCNNQFSGNYTPPFSTTSAATPRMKPYGHAIVIIVALAVRVLL